MIDTYFYNPTLLYDNTPQIVITTPNTTLPVPLNKVKNNLRMVTTAEDEEIQDCIWAAAAYIEWYTGRALHTTQYKQYQRFFWGREIRMLRTPATAITSITYRDTNGVTQTLDSSIYELMAGADDRPQLVLKLNQSWPTTDRTSAGIEINFTAGVTPATDPTKSALESRLLRAIVLLSAHLFNNRESMLVGRNGTVQNIPRHLEAFIGQLRTKIV